MNGQMTEVKSKDSMEILSVTDYGESVAPKLSLFDLLLNSPLSGSSLEIIRERDDFADERCTPVNLWGEIEMQ